MPEHSPTRIDSYPTVRTPLPSPPLDDRLTIDLREPIDQNATVERRVIDLRRDGSRPAPGRAAGPTAPARGARCASAQACRPSSRPRPCSQPKPHRHPSGYAAPRPQHGTDPRARRGRRLAALARRIAARAQRQRASHAQASSPATQTATVVATVRTDGNPGRLNYRWTRNDGTGSGTLVQSLRTRPAQRRPSPDLVLPRPRHLQRASHGATAVRRQPERDGELPLRVLTAQDRCSRKSAIVLAHASAAASGAKSSLPSRMKPWPASG